MALPVVINQLLTDGLGDGFSRFRVHALYAVGHGDRGVKVLHQLLQLQLVLLYEVRGAA